MKKKRGSDENRSTDLEARPPLADEAVQLAVWVAELLGGAEKLGIKSKPIAEFPLRGAKRAVVLSIPVIDANIRNKLATEHPNLTVAEVGSLLLAISEALFDATPSRQVILIMTAKCLMDCLRSEINQALKPAADG